jgi:hypothetical protein
MNQDQWIGRVEIALGAATELVGAVLHSANLQNRGLRQRTLGRARTRYGSAVAAVARRSH